MAYHEYKEAFLRKVEDPDFDQVEEILDPDFLLPWMGIKITSFNSWVSSVHHRYWAIKNFQSYSVSTARYAKESYQDLVHYLLSWPVILQNIELTSGMFPWVTRLRKALLKNPTTPSSFLFSEPILQRHWPAVAKHPMLPLFVEMGDEATLQGIYLYFTRMESTVSEVEIRNSWHTPLLYELIKDLPRLDMAFVALVDEFVQEAFPGSTPLPKLTKNTDKAKQKFSSEMAGFFNKENNRVTPSFTSDAAYGLLLWRRAPRQPSSNAPDRRLVEDFCDFSFQNMFNNDLNNTLHASMTYLRWLHKVAALTKKPMPEHLLSEVIHG